MKKIAFFMFFMYVASLGAQVKPQRALQQLNKKDYIFFINKTNDIIKEAWKVVDDKQVYTGALLIAKDFQKQAIAFFKNKEYQKALTLSANARDFCYHSYVKNMQQDVPRDWRPGPKYRPFINKRYTKNEIENKLKQVNKEDEKNFSVDDLIYLNENSKGKKQNNKMNNTTS